MSNFIIEKGKENDWEDAMALAYRIFQKYVAAEYSKESVDNFVSFITDQHLYRMFMIDEYHLWVARSETGEIIGMGSLRSGNHISLLFVDDKWQRMGVGRSIIHAMEDFVSESDKTCITVNASPYGIPFYHSVGFVDTDKETVNGGMIITPMKKMIFE